MRIKINYINGFELTKNIESSIWKWRFQRRESKKLAKIHEDMIIEKEAKVFMEALSEKKE